MLADPITLILSVAAKPAVTKPLPLSVIVSELPPPSTNAIVVPDILADVSSRASATNVSSNPVYSIRNPFVISSSGYSIVLPEYVADIRPNWSG